MQIRPVSAKFLQADRRTDGQTEVKKQALVIREIASN